MEQQQLLKKRAIPSLWLGEGGTACKKKTKKYNVVVQKWKINFSSKSLF